MKYFSDWRYKKDFLIEELLFFIAYHLPRRVVYYAAIRLLAHATTGRYGNEETPAINGVTALKRWND